MAKTAKTDYQTKLGQLGERLINSTPATPLQEVRPVAPLPQPKPQPDAHPRGAHFNFWGDPDLMERIRLHAFVERKTIKEVCNDALEYYMAAVGKPKQV